MKKANLKLSPNAWLFFIEKVTLDGVVIRDTAFTAVAVMPGLLLLKPFKRLRSSNTIKTT